MKSYLVRILTEAGYTIKDFGTHSEESVDYPDFIHPVARSIDEGHYPFAVILCGSGQGAAMTANKYPRVRAALCWDVEQTRLTRQHNNANILVLPGRFLPFEKAAELVKVFLDTPFEGGRHQPRIDKIQVGY
jgi:ribose 5-phosphate isomerase B